MNTTQNTKPIIIAAGIAVVVGLGLGGCADQPNADLSAQQQAERAETRAVTDAFIAAEAKAHRLASEITHEVARAENRVQAAQVPTMSAAAYRDQAERRSDVTSPLNSTFDQVERRLNLGH